MHPPGFDRAAENASGCVTKILHPFDDEPRLIRILEDALAIAIEEACDQLGNPGRGFRRVEAAALGFKRIKCGSRYLRRQRSSPRVNPAP